MGHKNESSVRFNQNRDTLFAFNNVKNSNSGNVSDDSESLQKSKDQANDDVRKDSDR